MSKAYRWYTSVRTAHLLRECEASARVLKQVPNHTVQLLYELGLQAGAGPSRMGTAGARGSWGGAAIRGSGEYVEAPAARL